tara:strand:- start:11088 stop:11585 length:498 start_codon:yes stop_codon:yes gene_type:complete
MEEMTQELTALKWNRNYERKNVLQPEQKYSEGFVLGDVYSWAHKDVKETGARIQKSRRHKEKKYHRIWELTQEIGKDLEYTSVQFNKNQKCKKHIDGKNTGISTIIGLGDYEGGELLIYFDGEDEPPTPVDIKGKFYEFDGSKYYHETADFTGNRFSLVFFNRHF